MVKVFFFFYTIFQYTARYINALLISQPIFHHIHLTIADVLNEQNIFIGTIQYEIFVEDYILFFYYRKKRENQYP